MTKFYYCIQGQELYKYRITVFFGFSKICMNRDESILRHTAILPLPRIY